jgi:hypothetical protein
MPKMPLTPAPLREWKTSSAALQLPSTRAAPAAATSCARGIDSNDAPHTFHFNRYIFLLKPHTSHTSHLTPHTPHLIPHTSRRTPHTSHLAPRTSHHTPHTSHLTPHTSHLTPHTTHLTPHTSHLTPHTSHHTSHTSHLTSHTSHPTPHTSHLTPHTSYRMPHTSNHTPQSSLFRFSIGDDFQWEAALEPFSLWDELIDAVNADGRVRVQYSTPGE